MLYVLRSGLFWAPSRSARTRLPRAPVHPFAMKWRDLHQTYDEYVVCWHFMAYRLHARSHRPSMHPPEPQVCYHYPCSDGIYAALAAHARFEQDGIADKARCVEAYICQLLLMESSSPPHTPGLCR